MKVTYDRPTNADLQICLGKVNSCNLDMQDAYAVIVRKIVDMVRHVQWLWRVIFEFEGPVCKSTLRFKIMTFQHQNYFITFVSI